MTDAQTIEKPDLTALLARVEAAEGSDRELDRAITVMFGAPGRGGLPTCAGFVGIGPFTASLDAALALCERVLPGWRRKVSEDGAGAWFAAVLAPGARVPAGYCSRQHMASPSLALLAALLTAKIAEAQS